jgi:hypothetical protein
MKLYLLKTNLHNDFYIVANDPTEAETMLMELLNHADYGFSKDRTVKTITVVDDELKNYSWEGGKPNFPEYGGVLILQTSCK